MARHLPAEQQPSLHELPAQQTSPSVPHRTHTLSVPLQASPAWHVAVVEPGAQQAWPEPPQAVQVPLLQSNPS